MRKLIVEIGTWLALEILFHIAGLDDLSNYSEFVFAQKSITLFDSTAISLLI